MQVMLDGAGQATVNETSRERVILHCDCNSFFASVELLAHPALRSVPVAVCGNPENRHGIILAKNEPAKKFGVQTAETIQSALRKCPQLTLLPPHHAHYTQLSQQINTIYARFSDRVEPFGIDESWLDMTGTWRLFGESPLEVADIIRRAVTAETGLTISVGVSFNKVFAKLGSDYKKPDAVTVFDLANYKRLIWPMPVGTLLYVGKSAQAALAGMGIRNIGQLAAADPAALRTALGKLGPELNRYALGLDDAPVRTYGEQPEMKSVGNGLTFKRNLLGRADVRAGVFSLADEVATRLRHHGLRATTVQIVLKDIALKCISRQKQLPYATWLAKDLSDACMELIEANWDLHQPIRMLTVTALHLTRGTDVQQLSFLAAPPAPSAKRESLEKSMDDIRRKYGKMAIALANVVHNDIGLEEVKTEEGAEA